mmetsp:Transcript_38679/g.62650  ORF Transcript_38679/g.62650 Transcript_38679/m.62650 type:complete len:81 (+) Transcript_38679:3390-3632(+)
MEASYARLPHYGRPSSQAQLGTAARVLAYMEVIHGSRKHTPVKAIAPSVSDADIPQGLEDSRAHTALPCRPGVHNVGSGT